MFVFILVFLCYLFRYYTDVEVEGESGDVWQMLDVVAVTRPDVLCPHLALETSLGARRLGMGAAVTLVFFPVLVVFIIFLTRRMLRERED
jgi:hypothetical protein